MGIRLRLALPLAGAAAVLACAEGASPFGPAPDDETTWVRARSLALDALGPPPPSPENPWADDPAAARLGHRLFFDARLSRDGRIACATCHRPDYRFTEPAATARGLRPLTRRTPTLVGAAWLPFVHWDGRKDSLWAQALAPLESPDEHGTSRLAVARVIADGHRDAYESVFGPLEKLPPGGPVHARPVPGDPDHPHDRAWRTLDPRTRQAVDIVFVNGGRAIEAYLRRLRPTPSAFDRYVSARRAGDPDGGGHLSPEARRGLSAFVAPDGCIGCHNGPLLTDRSFHNLGLPPVPGIPDDDPGRAHGARAVLADPFRCGGPHGDATDCPELRFLDPDVDGLTGAFKTPSLRNVAARPPYMHAGQLPDLPSVLGFYRTLPGEPAVGRRAALLHRLDRRVDPADLLAFLEALTGEPADAAWFEAPLDP